MDRRVTAFVAFACLLAGHLRSQDQASSGPDFDRRWPRIAAWVDAQQNESEAAVVMILPGGEVAIRCTSGLGPQTPIPLFGETVSLRREALTALSERDGWEPDLPVTALVPELSWAELPVSGLIDAKVRFQPVYRGWIRSLDKARSPETVVRLNLHNPRVSQFDGFRSTEGGALAQWIVERGFSRPWEEVLREVVAPRLGIPPADLFARAPEDALRCPGWAQVGGPNRTIDRADVRIECEMDGAAAVRLSSIHRLPVPEQVERLDAVRPAGLTLEWRGGLRTPVRWFRLADTTCVVVRAESDRRVPVEDGWRYTFERAACRDLAGIDVEFDDELRLGGGAGGLRGRPDRFLAFGRYRALVPLRRGSTEIELHIKDESSPVDVSVGRRTVTKSLDDIVSGRDRLRFSLPDGDGTSLEFSLRAGLGAWTGFVTEADLESGGRFPFAVTLERPDVPEPELGEMLDAMPDGLLPQPGSPGPAQVFVAMIGDEVSVSVGGRIDAQNGSVVTSETPIPLGGLTRVLTLKALEGLAAGGMLDGSLWLSGLEGLEGLRAVRLVSDLFSSTEPYVRFLEPGETRRSVDAIVSAHLIPRRFGEGSGPNIDGAFAVLQRGLERSGAISEGAHAWIRQRLNADDLLSDEDVDTEWMAVTSRGVEPMLRGEVDLMYGLHARPGDALAQLAEAARGLARRSDRECGHLGLSVYESSALPGARVVSLEGRNPRMQVRFYAIPELELACLAFSNIAEPLRGGETAETQWVDRMIFEFRQGLRTDREEFDGGRMWGGRGRGRLGPARVSACRFEGQITLLGEPEDLRFEWLEDGSSELVLGGKTVELKARTSGRDVRGWGELPGGTEVQISGRRSFWGTEMDLALLLTGKDGYRTRFRLPARAILKRLRD